MAIAQRILEAPRFVDLRSDRKLVRAAQAGDTNAASALIERHYPRILSFATYMGNGNGEDLAQEVFAKALTALPRFNGSYKVGPWLMRIAKNLCIDEARRNTHRPSPTDPAELPEIQTEDADDDVWESVQTRFASRIVKKALSGLPARQRAALVLREVEHNSYAEIAQVLGTNIRGAEATLRRARARFRTEVANSQGLEAEEAACQRTLRLIADDKGATLDVKRHLKTCSDCRSKRESVLAADKLFGLLPPIAISGKWKADLLSGLKTKAVNRPRGLMQTLRGRADTGLISPITQIAEMVASITMAGAVSVSAVAGVTQRVVTAVGAPPVEAAVEAPADPARPAGKSATKTATLSPTVAPEAQLPSAAPDELAATEASVKGLVSEVTDALAATALGTDLPEAPTDDIPAGDNLQAGATLPSAVNLPRKRRRS